MAENPSNILMESFVSSGVSISEDVPEKHVNDVLYFLKGVGISDPVPDHLETKNIFSYLIRGIIKPLNIQRGRLTCLVSVNPAFTNFFGGFHGGAIASVAEAMAVATARTVVAEDKELFLGELSISYLSSAPKNAEVIVDVSVVRSGRNLTVIAQEFKLKKKGNLIYTARATFYHMPVSKLQRWKDSIALTESVAFISKSTISKDIPQEHLNQLLNFLKRVGVSGHVPDECNTEDFYSDLFRGILKPLTVRQGHITCFVSVVPAVINSFGGFHGGTIAAIAEAVSMATAKTVLAQDKEVFLGELSISYLSSAPKNVEVTVDASVVRTGRNLTVVATEFKLKKTEKLVYTARATLFHMPAAKL